MSCTHAWQIQYRQLRLPASLRCDADIHPLYNRRCPLSPTFAYNATKLTTTPSMPLTLPSHSAQPEPLRKLIVAGAILFLFFSLPLYHLVRFALQSTLYTHILLIPFIGLYLVFQRRPKLPGTSAPNRKLAVALFVMGAVPLIGLGLAAYTGSMLAQEDSLALTTFSFLGFFASTCAFLLGRQVFRSVLFPLTFLLFMVPLPVFFVEWIEGILQHGSAAVAHALFTLAGTTVFVDGLIFQLANITLQIAPECSGIHSSLALFITSIIAGYIFLQSPGKRAVLALAVIPLALARNGLRVFVIGELCVHMGPEMIDSYIHRHGGPLFFVLSLIPFFLLLFSLVKSESKARRPSSPQAHSPSQNLGSSGHL